MDLSGVTSFFNRTLQKTEEAFKTTDKTLLDAHLEDLIKQRDMRQRWAQSLLNLVIAFVQPNPANRMEDMVLKGFDRKKERINDAEQLGESMISISRELGSSGVTNGTLAKSGEAEVAVGKATRDFQQAVESGYAEWLRNFIQESSKAALKEREKLENVRLDLDRVKTQLKRTKDDVNKKQQLEQQLTELQTAFDRQCQVTRRALEQCVADFDKNAEPLKQMLNAQREYYQTCLKAVETALN
ncbi:hypothetical protein P879_03626 [Paragonimus westermani]|uniref:BAR domain-containing protein n=1 Tax=Paragonimus westermani TaxID=34504 RepID=A0A8T0DNA5_9TREM|nr:hypothetical protein P879_03626 [Paragonimus westermani]